MAPQEQPEAAPLSMEAPQPAAPLGEFSRIAMVFSSPAEAFKDIAARPRWWVPVVLLALLGGAFSFAFGAKVGYDRAARQILETSPQTANMTPQQLEAGVARIAQFLQAQSYVGFLVTTLMMFVVALCLKFVFDVILGADIGLKRMMAIVTHSWLPMLIYTALMLLVLNLKPADDFNVTNPLAFNVGAFLGSDTPLWLRSLGASLDLFSFWVMALMAVGISVASRKVTFSKALSGVVFLWAVYVLGKVGAVALQSARG